MEFTKVEMEVIDAAVDQAAETQLGVLNELQLTLVGGGNADVTFC